MLAYYGIRSLTDLKDIDRLAEALAVTSVPEKDTNPKQTAIWKKGQSLIRVVKALESVEREQLVKWVIKLVRMSPAATKRALTAAVAAGYAEERKGSEGTSLYFKITAKGREYAQGHSATNNPASSDC